MLLCICFILLHILCVTVLFFLLHKEQSNEITAVFNYVKNLKQRLLRFCTLCVMCTVKIDSCFLRVLEG